MNKSDIIRKIAEEHPALREIEATKAVNAVFDEITEALASGNRVELRGFGSFYTKQFGSRIARNPKTGASVAAPATCRVKFRTGEPLRRRLNP